MNSSSPSLQDQLLSRVAQFQKRFPTITQAEIARHCGIGEANFSAAIAGRRGLSANNVLQLDKLPRDSAYHSEEQWSIDFQPILRAEFQADAIDTSEGF